MKNFIRMLIVVVFFALVSSPLFAQNLEIHHIDVGQGDAILVIGPNGTTILIDAGDAGWFGKPDGGEIVFKYLERINVGHLDYIVATHRDADHVGGFAFSPSATSRHSVILAESEGGEIRSWPGLSWVDDDQNGYTDFYGDDGCSDPVEIPDFREIGYGGTDPYFPAVAFDNGEETFTSYCSTSKSFRCYAQTVEAAGIRVRLDNYNALMQVYNNPIDLGDGATATIVCSSGWVAENPYQISGSSGSSSNAVNSRSIGLYIQYKGFDYLATGDLTGNDSPYMEQALRDLLVSINDTPPGDPVDVLKLNHHGSNISSEQSYLNDLKPEVVVISVGDYNNYEHPTQEMIERLHNIYPNPLKHIYLTEEGYIYLTEEGELRRREYYNMPHDFLYDAVVVSTDGYVYCIKNNEGQWDVYAVDQLYPLHFDIEDGVVVDPLYSLHLGIEDGVDIFPQETAEQSFFTGAAVSLMNLKYLDPVYSKSQAYIYNTYHILPSREEMEAVEVTDAVNSESPDSYNFVLCEDDDQEAAVKRFIHWIDYRVPNVDTPNVPALVPADGGYNWMVVRGFVTDIAPCNQDNIFEIPDFTFYGLWLADSRTEGLGFNVYQTSSDFRSVYLPVYGAYLSVVEPPEREYINKLEYALAKVQMTIPKAPSDKELSNTINIFKDNGLNKLKEYDWCKILPRPLKESSFFMKVFGKTRFSDVLKIKDLDTGKTCALVLFSKGRREEGVSTAFLIDLITGDIKQISWTPTDKKYPLLSQQEAIDIALKALERLSKKIPSGQCPIVSFVWSKEFKTSRFQPSYRIDLQCGLIVYVHQDGRYDIAN